MGLESTIVGEDKGQIKVYRLGGLAVEEIEKIVRKYVLANAVEHNGTAKAGSVLGLVLSEHVELRSKVAEVKEISEKEAEKINKMSIEEQKEELKKLGGFEKKVKEQRLS